VNPPEVELVTPFAVELVTFRHLLNNLSPPIRHYSPTDPPAGGQQVNAA